MSDNSFSLVYDNVGVGADIGLKMLKKLICKICWDCM